MTASFVETARGLLAGDFSCLAPLFERTAGEPPLFLQWFDSGRFASEPEALAEAFTCACFNGSESVAAHLLDRGVSPTGGQATGLNAFHWAANRGQLAIVKLLLQHRAPLETTNSYGGTVLGCAVWSAFHEPKPDHLAIIEALIRGGANVARIDYPTGNRLIDELLASAGRKP